MLLGLKHILQVSTIEVLTVGEAVLNVAAKVWKLKCIRLSPVPCPAIDSIMRLVTVWRITGKIIRTAIMVNYICTSMMEFLQF